MSESQSSPSSDSPTSGTPLDPLLVGALLLIGAATLIPFHEPGGSSGIYFALEFGDALRNIGLYVPFGVAWLAGRRSLAAGVVGALLLSTGIELLQLALPGRFSNPWDIASNATGALLGGVLWRERRWWWWPPAPLALGLVLATGAAIGLSGLTVGWLRLPFIEELRIDSHWTPDLYYLNRYRGEVTGAAMNGIRLPHGRLAHGGPVREALSGEFDLRVIGRAGPEPPGPGVLFLITDGRKRDLIAMVVDGSDLWVTYGDRAREFGLVPPRLPLVDALADAAPGSPLYVHLERRANEFCLRVNALEKCGLGYSAADSWTLLVPFSVPTPWAGALWLALLAFPLGFWSRSPAAMLCGLALALAGLIAAPVFFPLLPTSSVHVLAILAGTALGAGLHRAAVGKMSWLV